MQQTRLIKAATLALLATCVAASPAPSSTPQTRPYLTTLGDSITVGGSSTDPKTNSYGALLAKSLGADWTNLGVSGETLIPVPNAVLDGKTSGGGEYASFRGLLAEEVDKIPLQTTIVTVYIGTNDLWMTTQAINKDYSNESAVYAFVASAWKQHFVALVKAIRERVPKARIIVGTDINIGNKGSIVYLGADPYKTYREGLTTLVNAMNAAVASTGVEIANLHCDSRLYDTANYATIYDVHPNNAGHQALFEDFLAAVRQPTTTLQPCKYDHILGPKD